MANQDLITFKIYRAGQSTIVFSFPKTDPLEITTVFIIERLKEFYDKEKLTQFLDNYVYAGN